MVMISEKFTSFDIVLVDAQTAFDKIIGRSSLVSFNLSLNSLVAKVESDPLSRGALTLTERVPFDHIWVKPVD